MEVGQAPETPPAGAPATNTDQEPADAADRGASCSAGNRTRPASRVSRAAEGPTRMLDRHFADIRDGKLRRAYADLGGRATGASEGAWIKAQREDGLYSYDLDVSADISGSSATARIVRFRTEASGSGCYEWSGSWQLERIRGRWHIVKSGLDRGGSGSCG